VSAQQLVFEGPDPEQLLIEAWAKLGTGVRISEPVRVRKGGFLGFFAKLHYRIEVEPVVPAPRDVRTAAATSAGMSTSAAVGAMSVGASHPSGASTSDALDRLVDATEDVFELRGAERRSFDQVLEVVASSLGDEPAAFATSTSTIAAAPKPPVPRSRISRAEMDPPLEAVRYWADAPLAAAVELTARDSHDVESGYAARSAPEVVTSERPRRSHGSAEQLVAVGFPASLLARALEPTQGQSYAEAVFALAPVARPLPDVPGALIAVLGELGEALEVAGGIVDDLGLEETEIAVASPRAPDFALPSHLLVNDAKRAAALSPGWRRDCVAVVVVDCAGPESTTAWVRTMLRSLRPTATWSLASATSKSEDVAHFVDSIGGVDAIVLADLDATVTPAAILATGIPVARLDGEPATPAAWVDAVTSHLSMATRTGGE
jgi:hypothetical protein